MEVKRSDTHRGELDVSGIPVATATLRALVNGVPCWSETVDPVHLSQRAATWKIPLAALAFQGEASLLLPRDGALQQGLLTVLAHAADHQELARASMASCPLPDLTRCAAGGGGNGNAMRGWASGRLVAAALQRPGEVHTWRFSVGDAVPIGHPFPIAQVYLRVTFDADTMTGVGVGLADGLTPVAQVNWVLRMNGGAAGAARTVLHRDGSWHSPAAAGITSLSPAVGANANRPKPLPPVAWGEQSAMGQISHECRDSVFLCVVPVDTPQAEALCVVQWLPDAVTATSVLRYAIHGQLVTDIGVPHAILLASEVPAISNTGRPLMSPIMSPQISPSNSFYGLPAPEQPPVVGRKMAVIVGVSKYTRRPRGDLEWCDEDACSWLCV